MFLSVRTSVHHETTPHFPMAHAASPSSKSSIVKPRGVRTHDVPGHARATSPQLSPYVQSSKKSIDSKPIPLSCSNAGKCRWPLLPG